MGLFNNYMKDGPGVDVNAPRRKGIFLYFEISGRKFFPLIKANFLYFLISLPMIAIYLFLSQQYVSVFIGIENIKAFANDTGIAMEGLVFTYNIVFAGLMYNFFGSGPASAAYSYITRCFTRSQPVWVWSDGVDKFKENFKYSMLLALIDIVVLYVASVAIGFYRSQSGMIYSFLYIFIIIVFVIYAMSHSFMYQIIVTYDCKFKDVIKNASILTIAKLPMCVLLFLISLVLCVVVFNFREIGVIVYATVGMSVLKYPLEFYAARVIEKNIANTENNETQGEDEK